MRRAGPVVAWSAFLVTLLVAIGWGAHAPYSWDVDNIAPGSVLRAMAARFGPEWHSSYGPVPYLLIALLYAPMLVVFRIAGELGVPTAEYPWGFRNPQLSVGALIFVARLLCVTLAAGVALLAARERWSKSPRDLWLPPLLLAGSPAFVFYARTSNVDMFYLFFLALAFFFAGRARRTRALLAAGAAAALAICCKEQSAPMAVMAAAGAAWTSGAGTAARLRGLALVGLAAAAAYVVVWGLPFHLPGWTAHHRFLFEQARYPRDFPATIAGNLGLAKRTAELLPVTIGWPILAGAAFAVLRRASWQGLVARGLAVALYALGFLAVIGYVYPRFLLPAILLLLPLAVRGWSAALNRPGGIPPVLLVVLLAITFCFGGPLLGLAQLRDSRYLAGEWLRARLETARRSGALAGPPTAEVIGNPRFQVRIPPGLAVTSTYPDTLRLAPRAPSGDVVLMSSFDSYVVEDDSTLRAVWWPPLREPDGPYRLGLDLPAPRWSTPVRGLPISPVVWIWVRRDGPLDVDAPVTARHR